MVYFVGDKVKFIKTTCSFAESHLSDKSLSGRVILTPSGIPIFLTAEEFDVQEVEADKLAAKWLKINPTDFKKTIVEAVNRDQM